ncbi:hypothetical protein CERSUDRAFT_73707 [Gelatoporia subvermispora B]|uniref:Cytochrome P450 n=1 Tax=Ceriporiopsis subvermispora (strain B) TaxID=914234 RepID=M2R0A5_CERS8|nr:hypothetical protein CERSUDRAFT_73707 [Gelatoporia subvermispora B]
MSKDDAVGYYEARMRHRLRTPEWLDHGVEMIWEVHKPGIPGLAGSARAFRMSSRALWEGLQTARARLGSAFEGRLGPARASKPGPRMVILNTYKDVVALFEKKSANYSDRPALIVCGQEIGWDQAGILCPYNDTWREHRRAFTRLLGTRKALELFTPIIEDQARQLLVGLLECPQELQRQLRRVVAALTLEITHGYHVKENNDPVVHTVNQVMEDFSEAFAPGRFMYVPAWFPGAGWKNLVAEYQHNIELFHDILYQYVKKQLTVSAMLTFVLAMTLFPEMQQKAQREIDTVIGTGQLPAASNRDRLPYVNAVGMEVLRWQPVSPLGAPRRNMEDDIYNGYFFPKGTTFITNSWNMLHDPQIYSEPEAFKPERFIPQDGKEAELDPRQIAFGFSRRTRPGLQLADFNIFTQCAMLLAVFDVSKVVENGKVVDPRVDYTTGGIVHPLPFKYSLKPRNAKAEALIRQTKLNYESC